MATAQLTIRAVGYDHPRAAAMIAAVQAYSVTLYRGPDSSPVDPSEFAPPAGQFYLGYVDDQAVVMGGWRWIDPLPAMSAARPAEIKRMYVDAAARGQGHARTLLAHLEETARAEGADVVVLSTGQPQVDAIALYRSAGYQDVAPFGYFAAYSTAVHLGKRLEPTTPSEPPPGGTGR